MQDYLVFRLYGALASWGEIAVGESRHSATHPGKSAIMGLIAAALGIRRDQEERHNRLSESYGLGVKMLSSGSVLKDYHTTQVPPEQRKVIFHTRKDELNSGKTGTILSSREYRCDALSVVALWCVDKKTPDYSLSQIEKALKEPVFTLYLGRKSCPLSLPLFPQILKKDTLEEALDADFFPEIMDEKWLNTKRHAHHYYWDNTEYSKMRADRQIQRRDLPISRERWQFGVRNENQYIAKEAE
ncbi:MAG: type I-E CRISPR-associated protein Cas5/CasD [Dissulfuribacterales bacterium]